jgi:hypothetical protein
MSATACKVTQGLWNSRHAARCLSHQTWIYRVEAFPAGFLSCFGTIPPFYALFLPFAMEMPFYLESMYLASEVCRGLQNLLCVLNLAFEPRWNG